MNTSRCFAALGIGLALAATIGCGTKGIPISGNVTFNGQSVGQGTISLEPADGQGPTAGGQIAEGRYTLTGDAAPLPGKKIVRVFAFRKTGRKVQGGSFTSATPVLVDEIERYIPDIYNTRSVLICDVSRDGEKEIDFHLKSR